MLEFCFMGGVMNPSAKGAYDARGEAQILEPRRGPPLCAPATQLPRGERLFCLTIYYTGCRISEALALRPQDLDRGGEGILIRSLKKRYKREIRRLPVPGFLVKELNSIAVCKPDTPIWPFSRTTGWRIIKAVMNAAQISGIHATTKGLRHGFGVRGAMMQIPTHLIQSWMGHSDPSTTAIYLAVRDDEERELIEKTW